MSLFDDKYEDLEELYESSEEVSEDDDSMYEDDLMKSSDLDMEEVDVSSYFLDEELLEGKKPRLSKSKAIVKLKGLIKERHKIAVQFRSNKNADDGKRPQKMRKDKDGKMIPVKPKKKSGGLNRQLKYLEARKKNGKAIILTKVERYKELLASASSKQAKIASYQEEILEALLEGKEDIEAFKFQKGDGNKQQEKARDARFSTTSPEFMRARKAQEQLNSDEAKVFRTNMMSAKKISDKVKRDKDIVDTKVSYYTNQISNYKALAGVFDAYMSAFIAFVETKKAKLIAKADKKMKESGYDGRNHKVVDADRYEQYKKDQKIKKAGKKADKAKAAGGYNSLFD